jgi:hypothetical protein
MSPSAHSVLERLDGARQKWWLFTLLTTAVLTMCVSFGTLLLFMLTDALLRFHQWVLATLLATWIVVTLVMIVMFIRRVMRSQRSLEATARCVEAEMPEVGSDLINVVQLSHDTKNENRIFCEAAVTEAAGRLSTVRFDEAAGRETRWRRFRYSMQTPRDFAESVGFLAMLIVIAIGCHLLIPSWGSAANRLMQPWEFVPTQGKVQIVSVKPGNTDVMVGGALDVQAEIKAPEKKAYKGVLYVTPEGADQEEAMPLAADESMVKYSANIPSVLKPMRYRLEIGDSQSEVFHVSLRQKPAIAEITATYSFPEYLSRKDETVTLKQADLEAPQYTEATLRIKPEAPVASGHVQVGPEKYAGRVEDGGTMLIVKFPLLKDGAFTIHMTNDAGHTDPSPRVNRIRVLPDHPPTVELLKPARQETASPAGGVAVTIRASDDHVLGRLRLETKIRKAEKPEAAGNAEAEGEAAKPKAATEEPAKMVQEWTTFESKNTVVCQYRLEVPKELKDGDELMVHAVALDTRSIASWGLDLKPQEGQSPWHVLRIVSEQAKTQAALEQLDNLRNQIWKMLENQVRARVKASLIHEEKELSQGLALAGEVRTVQVGIQTTAVDIVKTIGKTDKEDKAAIKKVLNQLAVNEMLEAVKQSDDLVKIKDLAGFEQPVPKLTVVQDRIIETLRKLLDAARQATKETVAEMKKRTESDLPDDTKKKLEEAKAKLDKFMEQQKKVIEASENLAKKPAEDFSEADEQKIKQLAAQEDDLSKFMKELSADLSKVPEQDLANASMAKESVEIQTELKMAEDALLKKASDIAVPLEQLGWEMAESLKGNMEKWLPDKPDREKWSQEETLSDFGKESPMPELVKELEDLIGELAEQEEDLMEESQDVTSSAIDSPSDVGWDAADGPISSNSAKGVTGNQLPNSNEIGGRAGEGRSAKSSGEFVGDEAVGKGGRKTPSRLTPDPIMKGQIKDHSKDPQGGASGGGKESGEGGEGLEGPAPRESGKRDHNRLAGKQAALRNKAEGVDLQHFQVTGYHHQDLEKMIDVMKQVELDLRAGRYQNALRERKVLAEGLGNVKQYLKGEFEVQKDTTANLPTDVQKEILGSMGEPSPAGWEDFNRQYFESLSGK